MQSQTDKNKISSFFLLLKEDPRTAALVYSNIMAQNPKVPFISKQIISILNLKHLDPSLFRVQSLIVPTLLWCYNDQTVNL